MTIAKKPQTHPMDISGKDANAFIQGAGKAINRAAREKKIPIQIRIDPEILEKVDAAARRKGLNRTAWILYQIGTALEGD